ncbi:unnamed protein product, partial [Phaeothamnion confervicola]
LDDGKPVTIRNAVPEELDRIRQLYTNTYGDRYTLAEIMHPPTAREVVRSPDWHWMLAECEGELVASLLFGMERRHRLGKALGGVVSPTLRGNKLLRHMVALGLEVHLREEGLVDLVYAVVRTFVSLNFHHDLSELGFVDTGIFPNVRKVAAYETHGFKVCLGPRGRRFRRFNPLLIPELQTLYEIVSSRLALDPPTIIPMDRQKLTEERVKLTPLDENLSPQRLKFLHQTTKDLVYNFFPLHGPDLILTDSTRQTRVFLSYQSRDGHATILGFNPGPYDRAQVLMSIADYCENLGCVYLELLVSAYQPQMQAQCYRAGFLPCAYFPAAFLGPDGLRHDYIVTSKTFVPLHFRGLKLTDEVKPYLLEFFKNYTSSLWEDLIDA